MEQIVAHLSIVAQMNDKHFTALFLAVVKGWVNTGSKVTLAVN